MHKMGFGDAGWAEQTIDSILDWIFGLVGLNSPMILARIVFWIIAAILLFTVVLSVGGLFTFVFRRLFAFFTQRIGPNRVGPYGLFQLVADGLKLISKEDITPKAADKLLFRFAPYLAVTPFVMAWAPMPFSHNIIMSNIGVGIIFVLAISALSPLAEITAGWSSNNKYAIYGGVRAAALDFSYEIPMVIAVAGVILLTGSMSTIDIVNQQSTLWFIVPQILGAFIFFAAALAKAGLVPTDLPEAESELVAGYSTEYSGMRFGFFYVVLFSQVFFISALITTLYLGGWLGPFGELHGVLAPLGNGVLWFIVKTLLLCFVIFWLWLTLPRVRIDQYLTFAWKILFPLSLLNLVVAAVVRGVLLA
jgi:NADH-quinone oxidoreductase subunit H